MLILYWLSWFLYQNDAVGFIGLKWTSACCRSLFSHWSDSNRCPLVNQLISGLYSSFLRCINGSFGQISMATVREVWKCSRGNQQVLMTIGPLSRLFCHVCSFRVCSFQTLSDTSLNRSSLYLIGTSLLSLAREQL